MQTDKKVKIAFIIGTKSCIAEHIASVFSFLIFLNITVHIYMMTDPHPLVGRGLGPLQYDVEIFFYLMCFMYFEIFNTIETDSPLEAYGLLS